MTHLKLISLFLLCHTALALTPDLKQARESTRQILQRTRCASCHTPGPEGRENALKVYNLSSSVWSAHLNNDQLNTLGWILSSGTDEEIHEMGAGPEDQSLNARDRLAIQNFVDLELRFRRQNPDHRFGEIQRKDNPVLDKIFNAESSQADDCPL